MSPIGCLYMITMPNGKSYVGITIRSLARRLSQHNWAMKDPSRRSAIHNALRKYGRQTAVATKLLVGRWDYLKAMEPRAIKAFGTKFPDGYNLTDGGEGVLGLAKAARDRIAAAARGRRCPDHVRAAVSAAQHGRQHTDEHRFMAGARWRGKRIPADVIARRVASRRANRNGEYN